MEAQNAIYLDKEMGGKGRQFKSRFLVPGLVKYDYGVCLLTKENADKFIQGFIGCPVVINHQDVTDANAKDVSVGNIFSVWFDEKDGYYWCNGIITDKHAIELIDKGYSVSCQYTITEYSDNNSGALHNGNPYDKIIENGKPEHLAIVNNPRYEGAIIAVNAILAQNEDKWITVHPNGEENKGRHLLLKDGESVEDAMHRNGWYKKRQAKEEKNKKTVEEIKQDYIDGKISAKEAEKLLPKDTDTTSLAIAKYNKEHGIKDFDFDDNKQSDKEEKSSDENIKSKIQKSIEQSKKTAKNPKFYDGYNVVVKDGIVKVEKDGKLSKTGFKYDDGATDDKGEDWNTGALGNLIQKWNIENPKQPDKEENAEPKKYTYTLTKKEVGNDAWLGGMADTGNYYTNGSFVIDKRYLDIKGQEPKKMPDIDNSVKKILTETAKKKQKEETYRKIKDFEEGTITRENRKKVNVVKYSYYDDKNDYTENVYINKKFNDLFKNFELKFGGPFSPVYAYDGKELIGTVMPISPGKSFEYLAKNSFVSQFKDTLYTVLAEGIANRLGELIASNEDKWITIHPHGDDSEDYRRLKLKDGESPKEAMQRMGWYEKRKAKDEKQKKLIEQKIKELQEKAKKVGGENTVLGKKYLAQIKELQKGNIGVKEDEEKKPEDKPKEETKDDKDIINELAKYSEEISKLESERWKHSWDTPEREKIDKQLTEAKEKSAELSKKLSFMGDSWQNAKGEKVEVTKYEDGKYVVTTYGEDEYSFNRSYTYFTDAQKIFELKEADTKAFEKGQQKQKEKEARISKKVEYKKGGMPKAKSREEAVKLAEEYNIADSINYGNLSVDICNAMNESANDILAEFPKIRSLNKEFGSLQAKNKNLINEAFEVQGESLAIPIRANIEKLRKRYGDEYFERYYGNKETIEKKITEKVKSILKNKIGIYRASGEIAHCRYQPPSQAGVVWNEKYKNSKNFDYSCESGFHPQNSGSLKAIVDHEFGHQIERFIQLKGGNSSPAYKELKEYYNSLSRDDINNGLSKYGSTKLAEFIAEGFSEYKNNPTPRPMALKIGKLLTQAYKEVENNV